MSTSDSHEMPLRPEQEISPDDFGPYISNLVQLGIISYAVPDAHAEITQETLDLQTRAFKGLKTIAQAFAPWLNERRGDIHEIKTDDNGPVGILADFVSEAKISPDIFPSNSILYITHALDGSMQISIPSPEDPNVREILWSYVPEQDRTVTVQPYTIMDSSPIAETPTSGQIQGTLSSNLFTRLRQFRQLLGGDS